MKNKDWLEPFNLGWKHSETLTQSSNHKYRSKKWCGEKSNLPNQTRPNVFDSFCDCSSKINKAFYLLVVKIIHSQFPFCHTELLSQEVILGDHYECKGQHDSTQWTYQNNTVKVLITHHQVKLPSLLKNAQRNQHNFNKKLLSQNNNTS